MAIGDIIITILEFVCAGLILYGVWNREKLIDFEDKLEDRLVEVVAGIIIRYRRKKRGRV